MAKGETVGGLYIRLGLSYDELNQDFVAVEETISANIQRLNRENKLIQLKADIDLTSVTSATDKLKVQQQALTRQIELQAQKVKLYESSWVDAAKANGTASQQAQKAAIALRQQQLVLAMLSQRLKEVTAQEQELAKAEQESASKNSGLLGRYNNFKGDISGGLNKLASAFQGLKDASGSANGAITKTLEIIDAIPSPAGKAVAALAAIPLVVKGIENSLLDLAKPAVSAGDSFYAMARGLQMSMADAAKFNMICKVTGIEVSEVVNTTKRLQSQIVKAGKDGTTLTKALERYGVEAHTASGELKDAFEMSVALAEGLKRAQALGESRKFIASLGRGISGDYITYLEDLLGDSGNIALAASVVKNRLADPALAHGIQGNMNAMNAQAAQLSSAFSSAFMPIANVIVPQITARMGELVKIIGDNADAIKEAGFAIADMVTVIGDATTAVIKFGLESAKYLQTPNRVSANGLLARYKDDADSIKSFGDFIEKELQRLSDTDRFLIESSPQQLAAFKNQRVEAYKKLKEAYESAAEARKKAEEEAEEARRKLEDTWKAPFTDEEFQESLDRVKKINDELSRVQLELQFGDDNYGKALAELDLRYQQALEKSNGFVQEQRALAEWYNAERTLIEKRHADEIAKIREESLKRTNDLIREAADIEYHSTHNALENQLYDVERWKQAQLEKAETAEEVAAIIANAAAKEEAAIQKSLERAKSLMNEAADREYGLTHSAFEKQLYDIERWKQAQLEKAETAEEIAATVANAASREAEAVEQEVNRIKGVMESAQDRLARLRLSQRDYDLYRAQKQYEKDLQELPSVLANELLFAELNRIKGRQDGVSLGYTDKPPQYFKTTSQRDVGTVNKIFRDLKARLPSLVRVNPENYARYKAKEELQNAKTTAQIDKATVPFREGLKNAVSSVNDFSKAIQQATAAVRGGNNAPNNSTPATPATDAQNEAFTALSGLLGNGGSVLDHEGDISVAYLEELNKSLDNLDSSTRDALYAILDKVPEGINVDAIKELIRDNSDGRANIVYLNELEDALKSLPSDVREALQNALNGQPVGTVDVGTVDTDNLQQSFDDLSQSVDSINTPIENLADATQNAGTSTNAFSDELNKTADALDVLREKIANTPIQPLPQEQPQQTPQYDNFSDVFDKALKGTATFGELTALGGLATLQPEIALLGAGIEALANTVQTLRELAKEPPPSQPQPDSPATSADLSAIQQTLSEVSQTLTAIQQDVTTIQQEPPVDLMPLQEALQQSSSAETSALTEINTSIQATTQAISNAVQQNSQSTSTQLSQIVSEATQAISEAGEKVTQTITEATQEVMQSILSAIETSTQQKIESLAGNIQSVLQAIETSTQQMVQALGIVSQAMADMAQAVREARSSQSQPVNVTVNPNINLGGAYVFDNAMKQQLTNDIATEVINAVTSAVQTATQQANYGYGN